MAEKTVPMKSETSQPVSTREEDRFLVPPVDIYESEKGLKVLCDLPGVDREGLDVRVDDNILTIKGKTAYTVRGDKIFSEFGLLHFYRQFQLGEEVDSEKIDANLKHGVLTLMLPKAEKAKPRKIQVKIE